MNVPAPESGQLLRLGLLLQLERRMRAAASADALAFLAINELSPLLPCRQAWLWLARPGGRALFAASAITAPDPSGPYARQAAALGRALAREDADGAPRLVGLPQPVPDALADTLPPSGLWLPLDRRGGRTIAALALWRAEPWSEGELRIAALVADALGHAWRALTRRGLGAPPARRWRAALGLALLAAIGAALVLVRVPQTALAEAEVVPDRRHAVRAPMDGVVEQLAVVPFQEVPAGGVVARLDPQELDGRIAVAAQALEIARAELRQARQRAVTDVEAKSALAVLTARLEQREAESAFLAERRARLVVTAPAAGIVLVEEPEAWAGRPVRTGERIADIADPGALALEIRLPVGDAMPLPDGAAVQFYPHLAPDRPIPARVTLIGYRAEPTPAGALAFRLEAEIPAGAATGLRLGQRGTARLHGAEVSLGFWLLRRPLGALRQALGL